jgi:hypothetical protein
LDPFPMIRIPEKRETLLPFGGWGSRPPQFFLDQEIRV